MSAEIFHPAEGALLDLESLQALSRAPSALLDAWLTVNLPQGGGVVLSGLEPEGELLEVGGLGELGPGVSPMVRRVSTIHRGIIRLSAGTALLSDAEGRRYVVASPPLEQPWPPAAQYTPDKRAILVAQVALDPIGATSAGVSARRSARLHLGYVGDGRLRTNRNLLPIAMPSPEHQDEWSCDWSRFLAPEDPALRALLDRLARLQDRVWMISAKESVFVDHHSGGEWTQRQTRATAALSAARSALAARPTHTAERVRILSLLLQELQVSLEQLATDLKQILGGANASGPYRELCATDPRRAR